MPVTSSNDRLTGTTLAASAGGDAAGPFGVVIPERGRPDLLTGTLDALRNALDPVDAPYRVRVLVNGAPAAAYEHLRETCSWVEWSFASRALGFHGAITRLVGETNEPWVYLLNSDMRLAPDALSVVLRLRSPDVFAVASRIDLADPDRRRESPPSGS